MNATTAAGGMLLSTLFLSQTKCQCQLTHVFCSYFSQKRLKNRPTSPEVCKTAQNMVSYLPWTLAE